MNLLLLFLGIALVVGWMIVALDLAAVRRRLGILEARFPGLEVRVDRLERMGEGGDVGGRRGSSPAVVAGRIAVPSRESGAEVGQSVRSPGSKAGAVPRPPVLAGSVSASELVGSESGWRSTSTREGAGEGAAGSVAGDAAGVSAGGAAVSGGGTDWERFMGARLFAWLGGLALFLGVAYFVKYSFDRNLIPPSLRVLIGLATGVGLVVGGQRLRNAAYAVTSQTLCGTGVVVLYAALFAGHAFYRLSWLPTSITYAAMTAVTAVAFVLSVRMEARVVSVLGMLGGFLTPALLSSGTDQALALFLYVALLDLGLVSVASRRRWDVLALGAALGTVAMEAGWAFRYFGPEKVWGAWVIFAGFGVLFVGALAVAAWRKAASDMWGAAVAVTSASTLVLAAWLIGPGGMGDRPGTVFAFVLAADLCLLALAVSWPRMWSVHTIAGFVVFGYVTAWMATSMTDGLSWWGVGAALGFSVLHTAFPSIVGRRRAEGRRDVWGGVFPAVAVAALWIPLWRLEAPSGVIWPTMLVLNLLAVARVAWAGGALGAVACLILSGVAMSMWIGRLPESGEGSSGWVGQMLGISVLLAGMGAGLMAKRRMDAAREGAEGAGGGRGKEGGDELMVPVVAVLMPYLLLLQIVMHRGTPNPSVVFGAAMVTSGILLGLSAWLRLGTLPLLGMGGVALVGHAWWVREGVATAYPWSALGWVIAGYVVFAAYPWVARNRVRGLRWPWVSAALAAVPSFHLVYRIVDGFWPNGVMGLVPLAFAVPVGMGFAWEYRRAVEDGEEPGDRIHRLAWLGGVGLFLVTVAIPIQFDRQWLTLGLAMEGAALLWLFGRVPHEGLRRVGVGLLTAVFVRLVLNPAVLEYAVRGPWPLWNWWLYSYGIAAASMFAGAFWLRAPRNRIGSWDVRGLLLTFGTVLTFAWVNVEIADFFTPVGERVRFDFTGNFGRDMTYTLAWAVFALILMVVGLRRRVAPSRWAGLGLLAVATSKLFLFDLARLDQLYRVGALMGVALVAIAASMLYQRFASRGEGGL